MDVKTIVTEIQRTARSPRQFSDMVSQRFDIAFDPFDFINCTLNDKIKVVERAVAANG